MSPQYGIDKLVETNPIIVSTTTSSKTMELRKLIFIQSLRNVKTKTYIVPKIFDFFINF